MRLDQSHPRVISKTSTYLIMEASVHYGKTPKQGVSLFTEEELLANAVPLPPIQEQFSEGIASSFKRGIRTGITEAEIVLLQIMNSREDVGNNMTANELLTEFQNRTANRQV
jgi:hypothetical protein